MRYCPKCSSKLITKIIENKKRRVCSREECQYIYWNNPVPVVAILVEREGQYVIARNQAWPEGIYSVITGFLEQKESPETAALREVEEELGLTGNVRRHIGNYAFPEQNQIIMCYEVQATGDIKTNHELADYKLLSKNELSEYDFNPLYITRKIIADWLHM